MYMKKIKDLFITIYCSTLISTTIHLPGYFPKLEIACIYIYIHMYVCYICTRRYIYCWQLIEDSQLLLI